jgi:hypothetical protein
MSSNLNSEPIQEVFQTYTVRGGGSGYSSRDFRQLAAV